MPVCAAKGRLCIWAETCHSVFVYITSCAVQALPRLPGMTGHTGGVSSLDQLCANVVKMVTDADEMCQPVDHGP